MRFFERQFRQQIDHGDYALNPFERVALPYLHGEVLDLGCGLGNLALAAAGQGARVTALDGCADAIGDLLRRAAAIGVRIDAHAADLSDWKPLRTWDAVACIGLLMFFPCVRARALLAHVREGVRPGGIAVVNALVEGTTYLDMFDSPGHCLFGAGEIARAFDDWRVISASEDDFPAGERRLKRFETVIAQRPVQGAAAFRRRP